LPSIELIITVTPVRLLLSAESTTIPVIEWLEKFVALSIELTIKNNTRIIEDLIAHQFLLKQLFLTSIGRNSSKIVRL
jgi:hypothetical protein